MGKTISLFLCSLCLCLAANAADLQLKENAPERYIVVRGDTLWGVSTRYLKDPWRWAELWKMNRDQLKNPHLIYPGNILILDKNTATLRLAGLETVKLNPKTRTQSIQAAAIPSIPSSAIDPFLSQPLIVEQSALDQAPQIVALQESHVAAGTGDVVYVHGISEDQGKLWQIFRPGKTLVDPDTKEILGYEAFFLGEAAVNKFGDPSTVAIVKSKQEVVAGDRLLPAPEAVFTTYVPRAPEQKISGRIISAYDGVVEVGQYAIVTLNKGGGDGLEVGHVLAIYRNREERLDKAFFKNIKKVTVPPERYGLVFVFRTFEKLSYALVMESTRPVAVSDIVQTP